MPAHRTRVGRDELSQALARLRDDAGLSGAEAARRAGDGFSQSKISRWEAGRLVPDPDDIARYARALDAPAELERWLVEKARDLGDQHKAAAPARITLHRAADYQRRVGRIEADAAHVGTFHPTVVPGLLQTSAYLAALFATSGMPPAAADATIAARLERQRLLDDEEHRFTMILPPGALAWRVGSPETMAGQLEHIAEVGRRPNVRIGVIPWGVGATVYPSSGFDLYDERLVIVGTLGGAAHITDPRDVQRYLELFRELAGLARFGAAAREELTLTADRYRSLEP